MTKLNNEIRELSIDDLDSVTGGNVITDAGKVLGKVVAAVSDVVDYAVGRIIQDPYYSRL
jgi:hypothetical protein